jgi:hypothetical protein
VDTALTAAIWLGIPSVAAVANHLTGIGCPFRRWTGWDCPACGATRATSNLLTGHVVDALHYNALWIGVGVPLAIIAIVLKVMGWQTSGMPSFLGRDESLIGVTFGILVAWTVFRNLPGLHEFASSWNAR